MSFDARHLFSMRRPAQMARITTSSRIVIAVPGGDEIVDGIGLQIPPDHLAIGMVASTALPTLPRARSSEASRIHCWRWR